LTFEQHRNVNEFTIVLIYLIFLARLALFLIMHYLIEIFFFFFFWKKVFWMKLYLQIL